MALTDLECRKTKATDKLVKLSDMGGLQLWIFPNGSKLWRVAYRFAGKQKSLAVGRYPETTLLKARMARDAAKLQLIEGTDPGHKRLMERLEREFPGDSFNEVAKEYLDKLRREGRSEATMTKTEWLLDFARPVLGPISVKAIRPIDVLAVLRTVERRGRYESARRLRSTIGAVCRYAVATARADVDPTVALAGALTTPTVKSRSAITDPKQFGGLLSVTTNRSPTISAPAKTRRSVLRSHPALIRAPTSAPIRLTKFNRPSCRVSRAPMWARMTARATAVWFRSSTTRLTASTSPMI